MNKKHLPLLLFIITFIIYSYTLMPGTGYSGDCAKFQFSSRVLGVTHTPGYPMYSLISHIFHWIPIGTVAMRINLMSAFFASVTVLLLFFIIKRITGNSAAAFVTGMLFAVSRTFWSQAVVAEVYTLNSALIAAVILSLLKWDGEKDARYFFLACFIYAMSFAHHLTMILLVPAILYFIITTDYRIVLKPANLALCAGFFVLAALQYSYVFLRTYSNASYVEMWAYNLKDFMWWITGGQFKEKMFSLTLGELLFDSVPFYIIHLKNQFHFVGMVAGLAGACILIRDRLRLSVFFLLLFFGNLLFTLNYGIGDIFVFFIPSFLVFAVFIGIGLDSLYKKILSLQTVTKGMRISAFAVLSVILLVAGFSGNYHVANQRGNTWSDEFTGFMLDNVKDNSIILAPTYAWGQNFLYKLIGEKKRKGNNILVHWYWHTSAILKSYPEYALNGSMDVPEAEKFRNSFGDRDKTVRSPFVFGREVPKGKSLYFHGLSMRDIKKANINSRKVVSINRCGYKANLYMIVKKGEDVTGKVLTLKDPAGSLKPSGRMSKMTKKFHRKGTLEINFSPASRGFLKDGWSRTELSEGDFLFSWADSTESTLAIPMEEPGEYSLALKVKPFAYDNSPVQSIKLYVNNRYVDEAVLSCEWNRHEFFIPPECWKTGWNTVRFKYNYMASPVEITDDNDLRDLSVAFAYIRFDRQD